MIVVLDTTVIISAILSSRGAPAQILRRWETGAFDVATSPSLLDELRRALEYDEVRSLLSWTRLEAAAFVRRFETNTLVVTPGADVALDEQGLVGSQNMRCALTAGATFVVTGDRDLLDLRELEAVTILDPAEFVALSQFGGFAGRSRAE